jgi:pimeloyl-ACP methyl ester carboxylesterase
MGKPMRSIFAVLALAFCACAGEDEARLAVPAGAGAGDLSLEPCTYEARDIEYAADCGKLVVAESRSDPDSRLIALPVIRVQATGAGSGEPIFWLAGGPGTSNMRFSHLRGLIDDHDIVMVGYRGADGSTVLECPEFGEALEHLPADLTERTSFDSLASAIARCATRLQTEGVDLDGYTLVDVVQDMEEARVSLGYDRVDLLSQSYGTRLALIYAWLYPESIHRSAMISVNPPGHFIWYPEIIDEQLEYYADLCARDPECSSRTADLAESMRHVASDMPDRWLFLPIKRGNVLTATFMMLYHTGTAKDVFDAWLAAEEGDASGLALLSLSVDFMLSRSPIAWGESAAKGTSSDYIYDPTRDGLAEMFPPGSIIGAPASLLGWTAAKGWPAKLIPEELRRVQPSDVEMLLVSGSIDFSTPAQVARDELLPYLSNGRQVILSEFGHTGDVWSLQPEATIRLLTSFFETGRPDDSLFTYQPMDFHVGLGYPEILKLALAAVVAVLLGLTATAWFIVRKIRRRRRRSLEHNVA